GSRRRPLRARLAARTLRLTAAHGGRGRGRSRLGGLLLFAPWPTPARTHPLVHRGCPGRRPADAMDRHSPYGRRALAFRLRPRDVLVAIPALPIGSPRPPVSGPLLRVAAQYFPRRLRRPRLARI